MSVGEITAIEEIMARGVTRAPGVEIDGKIVHAGGVPSAADVDGWPRRA